MKITAAEIFVFLLTLTGIVFLLWKQKQRPKNFPPGPIPLPLIGNMRSLGPEPYKDFMRMREKYGDIIGFNFASYRAIILNDYKVIKKGLNEMAFAGRPKLEALLLRSGGIPGGVVFTDGQHWVEQRRFVLKTLRDFGFGKKSMEALIQQEIVDLIESFKKDVGKPIMTQNRFNAAVLNALWSIVTGERYTHDHPVLGDLIKRLTTGIKRSSSVGANLFFPWLRKYFPKLIGLEDAKYVQEGRVKTLKYMRESVKSHQSTYQENSHRDFMDVYLSEINKTTNPESSFYGKSGEHNLSIVMLDLFVAGAETTSSTLAWTFLLMALHPEIQKIFHGEIRQVVGMSRLPSLSDRSQMPYTEAVIMEVMRFSSMVPLGVQHRAVEDTYFRGYFIPVNTLVIPNLYSALKDPKVWGDPDNFRPDRFLSVDGKTVVRHEALIPFSTGKRVCLGETLARDELFLFASSLFQNFRVGKDPNGPELIIDYHKAAVLVPKPHNLILHERF